MSGSDEESTTRTDPIEKKKKKQKPTSMNCVVKELQGHKNKNMMEKKHKKKVKAAEEASEITDVVLKKRNNEVLDEDMASGDPTTSGNIPKKKTTLDKKISLGDPTSTDGTGKKKKKKNVFDNERVTCDAQTKDNVPKKRKKKNVVEEAASGIDPVPTKKGKSAVLKYMATKKKKRKKSKSSQNNAEDEAPETGNVLDEDAVSQEKWLAKESGSPKEEQPELSDRVKKKKKKGLAEESGCPTEKQPEMSDHKKKKKKKKKLKGLAKESGYPIEGKPEESNHVKVKKKKKAASLKTEDEVLEDHDVHHDEEDKKRKKTSRALTIDEETGLRESDLNGNGGKESDVTSEGALKKKKRDKEIKDDIEESLHVTGHKEKKGKSKKRKREEMLKHNDKDAAEVPKKKKKNKENNKKKREESTDGNTNPVHIDTVKRRALQEDIDRESGNTKGTKFGQWDTAAFQNSEQQTKFLRLLGGFKKGNQATSSPASSQVKANMALGKEGEQVLERNLLAEFDKAVSWKQNRGIGLGFQPVQNKTFLIDKTASRSMKFED